MITAKAGLCVVIPCSFTTPDGFIPKSILVPFKCKINNNISTCFYLSTMLSSDLNLRPSLMIPPLTEGQQATLTCTAPGLCSGSPPIITWMWRGKIEEDYIITGSTTALKTEDLTGVTQRHSSTLTFKPSAKHHDTNLTCKVSFTGDITTEETVSLNVKCKSLKYILVSFLTRYYADITEGDKIKLVCYVKRSNPQPTEFTWYKDNYVWSRKEYVFSSIKPEDSGTYKCIAKNSVGSGRSNPLKLNVQCEFYSFNCTLILKVNSFIRFTCDTKANPEPWFSWYRYKQSDPTNWTPLNIEKDLTLKGVKRTDEGCYICNASNRVGRGESSQPKCIQVLFKEGQSVTITCNAESFPLSTFELKKSLPDLSSSERFFSQPANDQNSFTHTFNVTSTHAGLYTCIASNSEGSNSSNQRKLEVEYAPKDVRVEPKPGENVKENESFSLTCTAHSNPLITQFKWIRRNNSKNDITVSTEKTFTVHSSKPSDSGLYICEVQNVIGSGKSQVKINIKYSPKNLTVSASPSGSVLENSNVVLTCNSNANPAEQNYTWYRADEGQETVIGTGKILNIKVSTDKKIFFCKAVNEIGEGRSELRHIDVWCMYKSYHFCIFALLTLKNRFSSSGLLTNNAIVMFFFTMMSDRRLLLNESSGKKSEDLVYARVNWSRKMKAKKPENDANMKLTGNSFSEEEKFERGDMLFLSSALEMGSLYAEVKTRNVKVNMLSLNS
uniref:Ig-like domain-containing protein n=1 Tax=Xiphophorus couchianus TaxID=32473 RepID=A0A3B5LI54_9TELE